jgi:hypothetical protein
MMRFIYFLKKYLIGSYTIRVGKYDEIGNAKTIGLPKIAPFMLVLFPLIVYLVNLESCIHQLSWIFMSISIVYILFGVVYCKIFESETPSVDDIKNDVIAIGFDKKELVFNTTKNDNIPQDIKDIIEREIEIRYESEMNVSNFKNKKSESESESECEIEVPTLKNTKKEIITYLESKSIKYKKSDSKSKLLKNIV